MPIEVPPPPPPAYESVSTEIFVAGRGPSPGVDSGILMTAVLVLGRTDDGALRPFFVPFMGPDEPMPALGARCTFQHSPGRPDFVGGLESADLSGEVVERFECDATAPPRPRPARASPAWTSAASAGPSGDPAARDAMAAWMTAKLEWLHGGEIGPNAISSAM